MTAIRQTARACSYASRAAFALGAASAAASRSDCSVASRSTYAFLRRRRCASVSAVVSDRPAAKSWSSGSTGARTQDQWKDIASAAMALSLSRCFSRRFGTCLGFWRPHPGDPACLGTPGKAGEGGLGVGRGAPAATRTRRAIVVSALHRWARGDGVEPELSLPPLSSCDRHSAMQTASSSS